jgi:ankyrin repeat protein
VDVRDSGGRTALLLATYANAVEAARVLIEAGADVNAKDDIKDTPYLYAGAEGRTEILKLLLAAGADLRDTNRFGGTALIPAAEKGPPENVRLLLAAGVDPNHVNGLGWTALLEAVILTDGGPVYQEIVADLIKGGADVNLADADGVTPLAHARARGYAEIGKLLEAAGAK